MSRLFKYTVICLVGGCLYGVIEILWRGHTHISMIFAGGLSYLCLYIIEFGRRKLSLPIKCMLGAVTITVIELIFGVIVNMMLDLKVWDYSRRPLNLMGQICIEYSLLWFGLCIPAFGLCRVIEKYFFGGINKYYVKKKKRKADDPYNYNADSCD